MRLKDNLVGRVARIIPRYSMLPRGVICGVAVSGGADSVALLHILHQLSPELAISLKVLHVNHQLRESESDEDELFVRELAGSLGVDCQVERAAVPAGNLEQEARLVRRAFFRRSLEEDGLARIALGHTRSDQAETVLYRLVRGAGLAGLAGMRPATQDGIIRPLLEFSRHEIRSWAAAQGIRWREDSSNCNLAFARNRLRNEVIPLLETHLNPNLEGVLSDTAELAQDEENYWRDVVETAYASITKRTQMGSLLQTDALSRFPVALQRRVIRRALLDVRGDLRSIDLPHVNAILDICKSAHGHDRVMVPGVDALRSFQTLRLARPGEFQAVARHYQVTLNYGETCELPFGAGSICVDWIKPGAPNCANFKEDWELWAEAASLDPRALTGEDGELVPLIVRNWEPGDQLQRVGHARPEKIKTLFQEGKVLLWERRHWPLLVIGNEIAWVRQFGPGAKFAAVSAASTQVCITYRQAGE